MNNENEVAPVCTPKEFSMENVKRCLTCNKIPLIEIFQKKDKFYIKLNCENGHKDEINLEDFLKNNKNAINKIDCYECKQKQENNFLKFSYCINCKQVLCNNCIFNHVEKQHQFIPLSRYDSTCLEHNQSFSSYCKTCYQNICFICLKEHEEHNKILFSKILIVDDYLDKIKKKDEDISQMKKIKNDLIEGLKNQIKLIEEIYLKYENYVTLLNNIIKNIMNSYIYEVSLNNYNYEIIENLKEIEKIKFPFPDFSSCKNIYEKSEKFTSFYEMKDNKII